jgi:hypothetical protein
MIPRTPKQKLLNILTLTDLKTLVDRFELGDEIKKAQSKDNLLRDLSRLKRVTVEQVVEGLSLDALQSACRELGLDDAGREKQLAQLILARFGKSPRRPKRAPEVERREIMPMAAQPSMLA